MQAKLSQWLGSGATPKAVELLPMDPKGKSEIPAGRHRANRSIRRLRSPKSGGQPSGLRHAEQLAESIV
jgi:hypothetical protein